MLNFQNSFVTLNINNPYGHSVQTSPIYYCILPSTQFTEYSDKRSMTTLKYLGKLTFKILKATFHITVLSKRRVQNFLQILPSDMINNKVSVATTLLQNQKQYTCQFNSNFKLLVIPEKTKLYNSHPFREYNIKLSGSTHQFSTQNGIFLSLPLQRAPMTHVKWPVIMFDLKHSFVWGKKIEFNCMFKSGILPDSHLLAK